ncbi:MAG: ISAs1 family transposase [Deltaproteobacteria bacterium]|nr:ISAs1 family transposase [Deltaproteobacteria bacterium]
MKTKPVVALLGHFASLPDPRIARHRWHNLSDILVIAVCAVLCGAERFPAIEDFGHEREEWLSQFLELPAGIPSHDTFNRVFRLLDPLQVQACFLSWMQAVAETTAGEGVAIDGKALRHSFDKGRAKRAIHMVSAWATANGVVLGQRKVDAKSNEITAIPELLDLLALKGCIVTIDAMGCQRTIAQKIVEQGADYVLALKGNQPTLEQAVARFFVTGPQAEAHRASSEYQEQTEQGHGRVETRCAWISAELDAELRATAWPGLRSIGMVEATRTVAGETSVEQRFYLSSLPPEAPHFARAVRTHWGIENKLPWTLDVTFREDQSRLRTGHGAENFAVLRHIALNLLRQEPSTKSLPRKRLACALNPDYLLKVLLGKPF